MPHDLHAALKQHFGHAAFRAGQQQVMEALLAGRSALALFPTSAGKSLCYQLPALLMEGVALIISPLIALMKDQVQALQARGIAAARLDSSLSAAEVAQVFDDMRTGVLKLLYIAPERLMNENFIERLKRLRISMMAVDEAHCISEWGHNFRPEYLRLAHVAAELGIRPVLALTATATPSVAADIRKAFGIAHEDHVQTSFLRPNLHFRITPCTTRQRLGVLTRLLQKRKLPSIVYVTLQQTAEEVATHLQRNEVNALAYHAGLPDEHRHAAQDAFMSGQTDVIVATIAFGMGIDKSDIRAVYHYNLPKTLENYSQETGRAGRDGKTSVCEMLACGDDCIVLENFTFGDTPTPQAIRQLLDHLLLGGTEFDVSMYDLAHATDIRPLVIETVITNLELDGILRPLGSFYASYQYRFIQPEQRILSGHKAERQAFLRRLFQCGKRGTKWTTINPDEAAAELEEPRDRVLKALTWLQESGDIELKPSGSRQKYRLSEEAHRRDPKEITKKMQQLFAHREERDVERLQEVLNYARHRGCLTRRLLDYFGESMEADCGTCTSCKEREKGVADDAPRVIPQSEPPPITIEHVAAIREVIAERKPALRSARQLARFLCGLTSPATTRERLGRHPSFGLLETIPFGDVLAQTETMLR
ncbi:RecQ family ATP-dependent DNA helicase [Prosthecobacter vanneervenii]|uniref:ATP-dependent DNA helicase RecQ n=1 Tax=Prosthecobacter vanneervenii TaxID=48466 RepID=A0A7W8DL54_9BACT|nr:ATP-dependent DNA helicase RecQ [Prosthecobacter vanneervenii]MBB5033827.1 ATP-dependent DNA helicase RecQ [Prosthecobacter vanneervenii]